MSNHVSRAPTGTTKGSVTIIGVADMAVIQAKTGVLTTHALGSCIGITIFDPAAHVGGLLHYMLPQPSSPDQLTTRKAAMFATTGIPLLFKTAYEAGATKANLTACIAGASNLIMDGAGFQIGKRNHTMLRKLFFKNNIVVAAEDVGGSDARTLTLDMKDGTVLIRSKGQETALWKP
ncbi:MAG: chemotaxis protein CheD [Planctomycetota bacterium]|jgi:chemotaxis protein CheD